MDSFRIFIEPSNLNTSTKKYFVKRPCYMTKSSNTINQFDRGFFDSIKDFVIRRPKHISHTNQPWLEAWVCVVNNIHFKIVY